MRFIERLLWVTGILLVGWFSFVHAQKYVFQKMQNQKMNGELAHSAARTPVQTKVAQSAISTLIGRIEIPRLHISAVIEEGDDSSTLRTAVGHIPGTALPG